MKKLGLILMTVVIALSLVGCTLNAHGGGQVDLLMVNNEYYEPGTVSANFSLTTMCNNGKDALMTHVTWNDQTNGVQFTARSPWTSIAEMTDGYITTCDEFAALAEEVYGYVDGTFGGGVINEKGQEVGSVNIVVIKPGEIFPGAGEDVCGGTAPTVAIQAGGTGWGYIAVGCLNKGNIVFQ